MQRRKTGSWRRFCRWICIGLLPFADAKAPGNARVLLSFLVIRSVIMLLFPLTSVFLLVGSPGMRMWGSVRKTPRRFVCFVFPRTGHIFVFCFFFFFCAPYLDLDTNHLNLATWGFLSAPPYARFSVPQSSLPRSCKVNPWNIVYRFGHVHSGNTTSSGALCIAERAD